MSKNSKNISVRVITGAKQEYVERIREKKYRVRVSAAPEKGTANKRMRSLLADYFGVSKNSVTILQGETSRIKVIHIEK